MTEECEFKDACFDAHMMLAEKEMLYKDSFCIVQDIEDGWDSCIMYLLVQNVLKKYVNRKSLEEEILERMVPADPFFDKFKKQGGKVLFSSDDEVNQEIKDIIHIIRNHGKVTNP